MTTELTDQLAGYDEDIVKYVQNSGIQGWINNNAEDIQHAFKMLPTEAKKAMNQWLTDNDFKGIGKTTWDAIENNPKTAMAGTLLMYIAFRGAFQGYAGAAEAVQQGWSAYSAYGHYQTAREFIEAMDKQMYGQMGLIAAEYGIPMGFQLAEQIHQAHLNPVIGGNAAQYAVRAMFVNDSPSKSKTFKMPSEFGQFTTAHDATQKLKLTLGFKPTLGE